MVASTHAQAPPLAVQSHSPYVSKCITANRRSVERSDDQEKRRGSTSIWRVYPIAVSVFTMSQTCCQACWKVLSSGAGRKGKGAAEREAMGGISDHGCFMSFPIPFRSAYTNCF